MVQEHYVSRVREVAGAREEELAAIETADQVLDYQKKINRAITGAFGARPRKTPMNPRVTGTLERPRHRIEKVIFESRPSCLVTANLYIPRKLKGPAPGVVAPCGHSEPGKAGDLYQAFCQRLAGAGFVVLIYDPFNQGERDQYSDLEDRECVKGCCNAHNMMGKQLELTGEFFGMWRAWDGVRALDYLMSRPEVDPSRIGLTGNSGGGTMTEWLWAVEDRFQMAAPGCFLSTYLANLENELPQDCEQYPPGIMGEGLEMVDLMIFRAPKPAILLGQNYDYFDLRSLQKAYEDLKKIYGILGREDDIALFVGPHGHGYHPENQRAMVRFFAHHAGLESTEDLGTETLEEKELWVTATGDVLAEGSKPIHRFIEEMALDATGRRGHVGADLLKRRVGRVLGTTGTRELPHYRVLRPTGSPERRVARYGVETEPGVMAILRRVTEGERAYWLEAEKEINLYVPHVSSELDAGEYLSDSPWVPAPAWAVDPRGMGESMPEGGVEGFFHPYGLDYMYHGFGLLLSQSYLGRRVFDVLATMDLLCSRGAEVINLYGRGQGSLIALFAAILHKSSGTVNLKNAPRSFLEWTTVPLVAWPAANFPRDVLRAFDLPDCHRVLGDRLTMTEPWGPMMAAPPGEKSKGTD